MTTAVSKHVFFLGLGGIGMSALARHLARQGHVVGGYDLTPSPLLDALQKKACTSRIPPDRRTCPVGDGTSEELTVVWTPAIPQDFPLMAHFARGITPVKRAALLGAITRGKPTLAVAGTHGKTTTSSWLAAMMNAGEEGCHAFLGGIDSLTGTNYLSREGARWHVVEADEFDRSFHHLAPTCAAITNLEPDHLDIYGTPEAFREAFEQFGRRVTDTLLLPAGLAWPDTPRAAIERFAVLEPGESVPDDVHHVAVLAEGQEEVAFQVGEVRFSSRPALPGRHNVANALVAAALAIHAGARPDEVVRTVAEFHGVHRRMDVHLDTPDAVYVDDYAHHPTELEALLSAVRDRWPNRHITLVFQPHLYSRTGFWGGICPGFGVGGPAFFAAHLPPPEAPFPGLMHNGCLITSPSPHKHLATSDSIFGDLKACSADVLVTAGAGDIDRLVPQALQHMQRRPI